MGDVNIIPAAFTSQVFSLVPNLSRVDLRAQVNMFFNSAVVYALAPRDLNIKLNTIGSTLYFGIYSASLTGAASFLQRALL